MNGTNGIYIATRDLNDLSDFKKYFDTDIYLPTTFPYSMKFLEMAYTNMEGPLPNVDYYLSDKQKYILCIIEPAIKSESDYVISEIGDGIFEQNEVKIDDSTEILYSFVSKEGFLKAFLIN